MSRLTPIAVLALSAALFAGAADAAGKRLARTDANGDGKITLQEFITARGRIFDRIDANHDGQLTRDEVAAFQDRMEKAEAGAMIRSGKQHDGAGGGQLKRLAKLTEAGPVTRAMWDALVTRQFQRKDTAGVGYLTLDQMKAHRTPPAAPPADPMATTPKS